MSHKIKPVVILVVLAGLIGGGIWYFTQNPDRLTQLQIQLGLLSEEEVSGQRTVSGFIEAEEISVAAETGGRIEQITVEEGNFVEAGQILVELDTDLLDAEVAQARAKIETARAQLAKVKAGVRAEEIAKAEAALVQAQANVEAARTRRQNAIMLRDNPQELDMQIDQARTALQLAEQRIAANIPQKDASETLWDLRAQQWDYAYDKHRFCKFGKCVTFELDEGTRQQAGVVWNLAGANMWSAWVDLNTAVAQQDHAEIILDDLLRLRNDPQAAQVQVVEAEAAFQTAQVEVEKAQAQLALLEAGPRTEQVALAQAQLEQAQANLAALRVQRDKHTLVAPLAGWVVEQPAHEGEMAVPGAALLTLANLDDLTLIVYVAEPNIDTVSLGQAVEVFVDSFPGEPFTGQVTFINDEAEFTPKNVQTKEERVNTVFAVKIKLESEDHRLKPGMPADAILPTGRGL